MNFQQILILYLNVYLFIYNLYILLYIHYLIFLINLFQIKSILISHLLDFILLPINKL